MKLRIGFSKFGKVRFTSHRDVARIWERALRVAAVPVAYSQGFSPRPRVSFGLALSTGAESQAEYLDVDIDEQRLAGDLDVESTVQRLDAALPGGFAVVGADVLPPNAVSLQQAVTSCSWVIDLHGVDHPSTEAAVERLLAADSVVVTRERKGKPVEDDLRPGVLALEARPAPAGAPWHGTRLAAELATQPRALRPSELLDLLGVSGADARVLRTHQWIRDGDARREPLPTAPVAAPARAAARASRREPTDVRPHGERPAHDPAGPPGADPGPGGPGGPAATVLAGT